MEKTTIIDMFGNVMTFGEGTPDKPENVSGQDGNRSRSKAYMHERGLIALLCVADVRLLRFVRRSRRFNKHRATRREDLC